MKSALAPTRTVGNSDQLEKESAISSCGSYLMKSQNLVPKRYSVLLTKATPSSPGTNIKRWESRDSGRPRV